MERLIQAIGVQLHSQMERRCVEIVVHLMEPSDVKSCCEILGYRDRPNVPSPNYLDRTRGGWDLHGARKVEDVPQSKQALR